MNEQDKLLIYGDGDKIKILASGRAIGESLMARGDQTVMYASPNPDGKIESCYWATSSASPHHVAIADGQCFVDRFYEREASPFYLIKGEDRYCLFLPERAEEAAAYYKVRIERRKQILAKLFGDDAADLFNNEKED